MKENPEYLENQREVNKNLVEMLKKSEGKEVVLQESKGDIRRVDETGTQEKVSKVECWPPRIIKFT